MTDKPAVARPAVVGGFILGALGLAVIAVVLFSGSRLFTRTSHVVVFFQGSVAGLSVGAPVTFRGVRVGSVERIALDFSVNQMTARIPVFLELEPDSVTWDHGRFHGKTDDFKRLVAAGFRAQLASQSFVTGQLRVDLDFIPGAPVPKANEDEGVPEIPAVLSDMDELKDKLKDVPVRELADTAQSTLVAVNQLVTHLDASVDPMLQSARRATDTATQTLQTTNEAVRKTQEDASVMLNNLNVLVLDARKQLDARSNDFGHTLATVDRVASQTETLATSLNSLTAPHTQFRGDLEATAHDLADSASSLRNFSQEIERNPSLVLTGKAAP